MRQLHGGLAAAVAVAALVAACTAATSPTSSPVASSPGSADDAHRATAAPACPPSATSSDAPDGPGWWLDRTFYEVFVRSFQDSDGDGIGDLRGLTARLDELNDGDPATTDDLGVTGIWLMPIMEAASYHGYDVTDYRAVEADYGTEADLRALLDAAHARGIKVIVDLPLNHTSIDHPWFRDARRTGSTHDAWYVWSDADPGYAGPDGQPVWHQAGDRWYYGLFSDQMPDLDLTNPAVTAELDSIAADWLGKGVDGFRLDAASHLVEDGQVQANTPHTLAWLGDFHAAVRAVDPAAMLIGEVWEPSSVSATYVPDATDEVFEFGLAESTVEAVRQGRASALSGSRAEVASLYPNGAFGAFLTNHDQTRAATKLGSDPAALRLAAALLLTGPGTPFVYYGEEFGLTGDKPDELIRTPLAWDASAPAAGFSAGTPWEPLVDGWQTRNVATQRADRGSLWSAYRDLIALRAEHPALRRGQLVPVQTSDLAVDAMVRSTADEQLLVLSNLSDAAVSGYTLDLAEGPLCGAPKARVAYGSGTPVAPSITVSGGFSAWSPLPELPPRSVTVISLEP